MLEGSSKKARKPTPERSDVPNKEAEPKRVEAKVQDPKQPQAKSDSKQKEKDKTKESVGKEPKAAAGARTENRVRFYIF